MIEHASASQALLLQCRPGFEKECSAEIMAVAGEQGIPGYIKTIAKTGFATFHGYDERELQALFETTYFDELIFPRQWAIVLPLMTDLPPNDRIPPIIRAAGDLSKTYRQVILETADTNDAKSLSVFLRKFQKPLLHACKSAGLIDSAARADLRLFFLDSSQVYVGKTDGDNGSPWPMGIPRLRFPTGAPSRSTLKLEEAFLHFLGRDTPMLQPAMTAVDLGAAPGGWTWQLVRRSIRVTAVDNGPMDQELLDSGIVQHLRTDGFRYRPPKPVDWLVCDMVEQPSRIAELVARWFNDGLCTHAIFNLKLPMKKRYEEVQRCREIIEIKLQSAGLKYRLRFKQLYHDREEVTGYCSRG